MFARGNDFPVPRRQKKGTSTFHTEQLFLKVARFPRFPFFWTTRPNICTSQEFAHGDFFGCGGERKIKFPVRQNGLKPVPRKSEITLVAFFSDTGGPFFFYLLEQLVMRIGPHSFSKHIHCASYPFFWEGGAFSLMSFGGTCFVNGAENISGNSHITLVAYYFSGYCLVSLFFVTL